MRDPSRICFVIPCKGRLAHLRESLSRAAAQAPCIVVDYDCPENSGDWVNAHHPEVAVVRIRNEPGFNLARARNLGAAAADAEWIAFLDADVVPAEGFLDAIAPLLAPGRLLRPMPRASELGGTFVCPLADFRRAGGYDEALEGWGGEDNDLYRRLHNQGLSATGFPAYLLRTLPHGDEERTRFYDVKDVELSRRLSAAYLRLKIDLRALSGEEPGIEVRRALHHEVTRVLGQSMSEGQVARIDVELPDGGLRPGWQARRTLVYTIPPPPALRNAPGRADAVAGRPPMPFIVGTGRCGTTLLRLMLDSHPELAIPPETYFLRQLLGAHAGADVRQLMDMLRADPLWRQFGVTVNALESRVGASSSIGDLLRAFYALYAERCGKRRYGDKTPDHIEYMAAIRSLFPEARFIHLIRDGRDVALSVRGLWWGPQHIAEAASWWACKILAARAAGFGADTYLEVRYEDLVSDPEATLRRVCAFIELPWDERMLRYPKRAAERLAELGEGRAPDGTRIPAERVRALHERALGPPDRSRIGGWRAKLDAGEVRSFELLAGSLLAELGYDTVT